MSNRKSLRVPHLLISVSIMALAATMLLVATGANAQKEQWQEHTQTVLLKTEEFRYSFSYPQGWFINIPDPTYVSIQNAMTGRERDLPEGFVKISFMLDPKANPAELLHGQGKPLTINGIAWQHVIRSDEAAGDRSMTLETVHEGVVFRISVYMARTGTSGPLFERQLATVNHILASFKIEPTIHHGTIPGAPTFPPQGKPRATPMGSPMVP